MTIKAKLSEDAVSDERAGVYQFSYGQDGGKVGLILRCPGCREVSFLPFRSGIHSEEWNLLNEDPIELTPSIHHDTKLGGCGWHGWLRNGEFQRL